MILLIDNYDSFVYNLYQYISEYGFEVTVKRNDEISVQEINRINPTHIVLSPGPGRPENAGIICDIIKEFYKKIPVLGICLGHQAIGYSFGAEIVNANEIMHGKISKIKHTGKGTFKGIQNPFNAVRYHSLVIKPETLPDDFEVTAVSEDGTVMAIMHKKYNHLQGIQFHPESILTENGKKLLFNFFYVSDDKEEKIEDIKPYLHKIVENKNLTIEESQTAMDIIMSGKATPAQIASFITALRFKGETVDEISGFAITMRKKAEHIKVNTQRLVDTCGTGGDMSGSFNISTCSAIVAAAAGVKIAKHGNRSVSSRCGSADILEGLGVNLDLKPEQIAMTIEKVGIGFLFAPKLHSAMKYAMGPRREMGIRTVFNILGPLSNPAFAENQVLGVFSPELTEKIVMVLKNLGIKRAFVVYGYNGLDEISLSDRTKISELNEKGEIKTYDFNPVDYGFHLCNNEDLKGGEIEKNIEIFKSVLNNEASPKLDTVILNAAFSIMIGLENVNTLEQAIIIARETVESGKAMDKLNELIEFTNSI